LEPKVAREFQRDQERKFFNHESKLAYQEKYEKIRNWDKLCLEDYKMPEILVRK
jgi:hypothetical protein